jgi:cytochrome c-type biogenesis protein CcmH/NrfF
MRKGLESIRKTYYFCATTLWDRITGSLIARKRLQVEFRMARKGKASESGERINSREPSFLLIGAVIFAVVLLGIIVKAAFFTGAGQTDVKKSDSRSLKGSESVERMVQLVASNFRCACGKCGELPLIDCECDLPRGATEEKLYIREKLEQGLPVQKVIEMVDEVYGHRMKT